VIEVHVEGLEELSDLLKSKLPEFIQTKALHPALTKAARPIINDARARVPVKTGKVRASIYSYRDRDSTKVKAVRSISVRSGRRFGAKDAYYWKWVEFGRGESAVGKKRGAPRGGERARSLGTPATGFFGKRVKAVPARPFLRPAFEAQKFTAIEQFRQSLAPEIEKAANRYSRQIVNKLRGKLTSL
jgi:HK97 gp10 family phage protein